MSQFRVTVALAMAGPPPDKYAPVSQAKAIN